MKKKVSYSVTGWLEKNKDPINMSVAALFKTSTENKLLSYLFQDIGVEERNYKYQYFKIYRTLNGLFTSLLYF